MMLFGRVINGFMLGLLGYLVINESVKIRKLNDIERFLYRISNDVKDVKEIFEQKDLNEFLQEIDDKDSTTKEESLKEIKNITNFLEEEKNDETGEVNPNLIYNDNTEEKSSDTSSDGWKEVRTDSENNSEEKNDECDKVEVEKTTKIE
tara:strand:+ start:1668 stop:2114 length:447 start_codon:yes stop_codon:yes gene_type:complete